MRPFFWYVYVQRRAPPRARGGHLILIFGAARVCGFGAAQYSNIGSRMVRLALMQRSIVKSVMLSVSGVG